MKTRIEKAYRKAAVKALIHEEEKLGLTELIDATAKTMKSEKPKPSLPCNNKNSKK
ncbi:hypothetical protein AB6Q56_08615 [Dechloromonas sp. ARDL1]|uniref:hypothetical protein n=1 Tax=Dechloromonas sp. ARDL1 TaxID=3322121 RepID=UPI003DA7A093